MSMTFSDHEDFAFKLDAEDPLRAFREKFYLPLGKKSNLKKQFLKMENHSSHTYLLQSKSLFFFLWKQQVVARIHLY